MRISLPGENYGKSTKGDINPYRFSGTLDSVIFYYPPVRMIHESCQRKGNDQY